jgi:high-affinity iron transporter
MYILSIVFAGRGIKALQATDLIGVTPVSFVESIDIFGIYPTVETLLPQVVLLALAVFSVLYYRRKTQKTEAAV